MKHSSLRKSGKAGAPGQLRLPGLNSRNVAYYGGEMRKKRAHRGARPISGKHPMHLVLKSSKAKGALSFRYGSHEKELRLLVQKYCQKHGATLHEYSNNFNHLHMLVRFRSRQTYLRFIRSLTCAISLLVTKASKVRSLDVVFGDKEKFWDFRPYTRVVFGWKGFRIARDSVLLNQLEVFGLRSLKSRTKAASSA